MIAFCCPKCAQEYQVKPEYAGRRTKCARCGERIEVPNPEPPPESPQGASEALEVCDRLLPTDDGAPPPDAGDALDEVVVAEDNTWGAERPSQPTPAPEEILPEVQPAPLDYLEVVTDDEPRRKKKKKDAKLPVIYGTDAVVEIRGNSVVLDYEDGGDPEKIHIVGILRVEVSTSVFGGPGVVTFVIGTRHAGVHHRLAYNDFDEKVAVNFPASELRQVMKFKSVVELLRDRLHNDYRSQR